MADNIIKVNVTSVKQQRVSVSSSQVGTEITASSDAGKFWAQNAKNWAVSENIVDNTDYSSKYYANKSKIHAQDSQIYAQEASNVYTNFMENVGTSINEVIETKDSAIADINSTKTTILNDIEFVADGEKKEIEDLIDTGKDELKEAIGDVKVLTTLEIGDIGIAPLGIDETKGLRRYLNGQLIIQDQYTVFTEKLKKAIELYPSLACTEEEWQTTATMTVGGQVGKFVVDNDAGTIRLPKIIMPIQGLTDLSKLGEIVEAGLPNITGAIGGATRGVYLQNLQNGALYLSGQTALDWNGNGLATGWNGISFNASLSNPIYGNSDTVQQEQIQYPYFIQVATGAETEDNIINEIELNNPYSLGDSKYSPKPLNNLSWLKSEGQYNPKATYPSYYDWALINANNGVEGFKFITDEYTDYDVVINSAEETFRLPLLDGSEDLPSDKKTNFTVNSENKYIAPVNGLVFLAVSSTSNSTCNIAINVESPIYYSVHNQTTGVGQGLRVTAPVKKGTVFNIESTNGNINNFYLIHAQGNGSLYFYVGETVQNANLINAGRIQEVYATKSMVDGQWVSKYRELSTAHIAGTYTIDLSDYLPNDGYVYEILLGSHMNGSNNPSWSTIRSSSMGADIRVCMCNSGQWSCNAVTIPIATDRKLTYYIVNSANSDTRLWAFCYRRIGTNQ